MKFKQEFVLLMTERKQAYSQVFATAHSEVRGPKHLVLEDLAKFCRTNESCFHADPRIHAALEGRREVMLRIRDYVDLSVEQLCKKYGKAESVATTKEE